MTPALTVAVILDFGLIAALAAIIYRQREALRKAKASTFGLCISNLVEVLAAPRERAFNRAGEVCALATTGLSEEVVTDLLRVATGLRRWRFEPALWDVGGEHVKALVRTSASPTPSSNRVTEQAANALDTMHQDVWDTQARLADPKDLALAQIILEKRLVTGYEQRLIQPVRKVQAQ